MDNGTIRKPGNGVVQFVLNGEIRTIDFAHGSQYGLTTTLLEYLRTLPGFRGTKEGCAEGDCGACTVVVADRSFNGSLRYRAVNSCLMFLPMVNGKLVITVEGVARSRTRLHPLQDALVKSYGSQCGFCTPGIVMSLFSLWKNNRNPERTDIESALAGNLCRCTGYQSILNGVAEAYTSYDPADEAEEDKRNLTLLNGLPVNSIELVSPGQHYHRPAELGEALEILDRHPGAVILNGATDVGLRVTKKFETIPDILDLSGVDELRRSTTEDGVINLGGGMTINEIGRTVATHYPAFSRLATLFGSHQIRNLATIAGNISTASPVSDTIPLLIALTASVTVQSLRRSRTMPIEEFITGYRTTARAKNELITAISIPTVGTDDRIYWYKISRRKDVDISAVSGAFRFTVAPSMRIGKAIVAYGGMDARARRAPGVERALEGNSWSEATIRRAIEAVDREFQPLSDVRGSADFRMIAAKNLLLKCWADSTAVRETQR